MVNMKSWLIRRPEAPWQLVKSPIHPSDHPVPYEGDREDVLDVEDEPSHPDWLKYRGTHA